MGGVKSVLVRSTINQTAVSVVSSTLPARIFDRLPGGFKIYGFLDRKISNRPRPSAVNLIFFKLNFNCFQLIKQRTSSKILSSSPGN